MLSCSHTGKIQSWVSHDQTPVTESKVAAPAEHTNTVVAIAQARIPSLASAAEGKGATLTSPVTLITPAAEYNAWPVPLSSTITTTLAQAPNPFSIISRGGSTSSSSSSLRTSTNLPTTASSSAALPRDPLAPPEGTLAGLIAALPDTPAVLLHMIYQYCYMVTTWSSPGKVSLTILPKREKLDLDIPPGTTVDQFVSDIYAKLTEMGHAHHDKRAMNIYDNADKTFKIRSPHSKVNAHLNSDQFYSANPILESSELYIIPHLDIIPQLSEDSELHHAIKLFNPGKIKNFLFDCNFDQLEQVEAYIRGIWQRFSELDTSLAHGRKDSDGSAQQKQYREDLNEKFRLLLGLLRLDRRITDTPLHMTNNPLTISSARDEVTAKDMVNRLSNSLTLHTFSYLDFHSQLQMCSVSKHIAHLSLSHLLTTLPPYTLIQNSLSLRKEAFSCREEVLRFNFPAEHPRNLGNAEFNTGTAITSTQENLECFGEALKLALIENNWGAVSALLKQVIAFAKEPTDRQVILSVMPKTGDQVTCKNECIKLCPQIKQGAWHAMHALLRLHGGDSFFITISKGRNDAVTMMVNATTIPLFLRMYFKETHKHDIALSFRGRTLEDYTPLEEYRVRDGGTILGQPITPPTKSQLPKIEVTPKLLGQYKMWREGETWRERMK